MRLRWRAPAAAVLLAFLAVPLVGAGSILTWHEEEFVFFEGGFAAISEFGKVSCDLLRLQADIAARAEAHRRVLAAQAGETIHVPGAGIQAPND